MSDPIATFSLQPARAGDAATASTDVLLDRLNPMQREAVEATDGPVLVLAGAGTGKTRVLTTRLAYLLGTGLTRPWSVLAVTFTNKAAREMRQRVGAYVGDDASKVWLGTFHAIGSRMLRRDAERVGLKPNFTILDTDDQNRLLKQIVVEDKVNLREWPVRSLVGVINRWKDRGLRPDMLTASDEVDEADGQMPSIYRHYQDRLCTLNAVDFGDLLLHSLTLLRDHPDILERYHRKFSHILVDEYQDTNISQYLWLRLLARQNHNICCVGDDDQSIYGWRGAEVGNILKFGADFPGARIVRLEQNYRSTGNVLAVASHLISHNGGRLGKTLWTAGEAGPKVILRAASDDRDEAQAVSDQIERYQHQGVLLGNMAVLVRTGAQTRSFEDSFLSHAIPYQLVGGTRFYERQEIRDAIAYLRVLYQPDDDLALERIVNRPRRGIGPISLQPAMQFARTNGVSLHSAIRILLEADELRPAARRTLGALLADFDRWRTLLGTEDHVTLVERMLEESGYLEMWRNDKAPDAPGRIENLEQFVAGVAEQGDIGTFLEHVSLVMERATEDGSDQVSIMTLHAAKGLEFDVVFLTGWEDGLFPNRRALDGDDGSGLEEERRLAYVGLTRARRFSEISFAGRRFLHGEARKSYPSPFLFEIPRDHVKPVGHLAEQILNSLQAQDDASGGTGHPWRGKGSGIGQSRPGSTAPGTPWSRSNSRRKDADPENFAIGDRVFHLKFGMGTVTLADGSYLSVSFDKAGEKRVVATFVSRP